MTDTEHLETFRSNLNLIRLMSSDQAEEEFYNLMEKAKKTFGDLHLYMGELYFEYAKFLLEKMEKNSDIFHAEGLPAVEDQNRVEQPISEYEGEDDSSEQGPSRGNNCPEAPSDGPVFAEEKEQKACEEGHEAEEDDFEICGSNLLCAIQIYEAERDRIEGGGDPNLMELAEIKRYISRCKSRLGDLYHLNENYQEAVETYRQVIADEEKKLGHESNRGLAEIHYMIANSFLYENKDGCEQIALSEFFQSIRILVSKLREVNPEDDTEYEIPSIEKVKVNRFSYLPKPSDGEEAKDIKEVIACLLDKIEDTYEQIGIRQQYQAELQKMKEKSVQATFKEISPEVPVIKLGTFGNRRKKAAEEQEEAQGKGEGAQAQAQKQNRNTTH